MSDRKPVHPDTRDPNNPEEYECGCMGARNGEPLCLCLMMSRRVFIENGRYMWVDNGVDVDLGAATTSAIRR